MSSLSKAVLKRAQNLGFTEPFICRVTDFSPQNEARLKNFIQKNHHGTMAWLEDTFERRKHPRALWPDAESVIVFGMNYGPDRDPRYNFDTVNTGHISVYARHKDYHDVLKGRLKEIAGLIARDTQADVKVFVDTAPLMEKPLAQTAGLGWQGKHTNLVSRKYGSWLFLGLILSAKALTPTPAETDHCGSCTACLDICPTQAFPSPYKIDARRCISYLTIEHKGSIDSELREKMGNRIYGCDDCLAACPWNKYAQTAQEAKLQARTELNEPLLKDLVTLDDAGFRQKFSGSAIKRIGRNQFIRNVLYAIGNSRDISLLAALNPHLSSNDPVVKEAAIWAKNRLENLQNKD